MRQIVRGVLVESGGGGEANGTKRAHSAPRRVKTVVAIKADRARTLQRCGTVYEAGGAQERRKRMAAVKKRRTREQVKCGGKRFHRSVKFRVHAWSAKKKKTAIRTTDALQSHVAAIPVRVSATRAIWTTFTGYSFPAMHEIMFAI